MAMLVVLLAAFLVVCVIVPFVCWGADLVRAAWADLRR